MWRKIILPLFLSFFLSLSCLAQTGKLKVQLIVPKEKKEIVSQHSIISIISSKNHRIVFLKPDLSFEIDSLLPDTLSIRISTVFYYQDTLVNNVIIRNNSLTGLKLNYPPFCKYDQSKNNKTCPVCHKKDQVVPIVYGLLIYTGVPKKEEEIYSGGCEVSGCDPHWHCKRDNKDF